MVKSTPRVGSVRSALRCGLDAAGRVLALRPGGRISRPQRAAIAALWGLARWPYPDLCPRKALLLGVAVRRRRPVLRLGILEDGFTAHAWVEVAGRASGMGEVAGVFKTAG